MKGDTLLYILCAGAAAFMIFYYSRRRRRLLSVLFGALSGIAALLLLNHFGEKWGIGLPLNIFNICGSAVLGVPFVACLVIVTALL